MAAATVFSPPSSLGDYSAQHFQSLPLLEVAKDNFLVKANGEEVIKNIIKDFVVKAGMDRTFGVAMIHRHFDLEDNEKMVDYQGTSTPWLETIPGMKSPQAAIWAFDKDGVLRPTEFYYSERKDAPLSKKALEFIGEFKALLDKLNLTGLLGLSRYPGDDFQGSCEVTHSRANINLKPEDYPANLVHIPTIWFFSEPLWKRGCRCTCNANGDNHPHGYHTITVSG
ncbi:hypothetical protein CTA2_2077 [Colletotrichum tanaceti]|uniref:Uncharacterized protein n=1 Tax=Colletotrichum tanaceti TaxID=1306861 RepID=A0A4U6X982_9PEZI|nr:hypothetical protein CTA2_2077 [Colletotrichum tanaceti]TKW51985.1 hypothetical protein CTA1_11019 [Colletotrichum tanaceti]